MKRMTDFIARSVEFSGRFAVAGPIETVKEDKAAQRAGAVGANWFESAAAEAQRWAARRG